MIKNKKLLLIFTRNPELGKVKSRLAADIGNENALAVYVLLLNHTRKVTENSSADKQVWYSEKISDNDLWSSGNYDKHLQKNVNDLGTRMEDAFNQGFRKGYEQIIIIGSDLFDITESEIENAFNQLQKYEAIIGPATDGGFYLLGLSKPISAIFKNKNWGTPTVLNDTLINLKKYSFKQLPPKNDIDYLSDIEGIEAFKPFTKK